MADFVRHNLRITSPMNLSGIFCGRANARCAIAILRRPTRNCTRRAPGLEMRDRERPVARSREAVRLVQQFRLSAGQRPAASFT